MLLRSVQGNNGSATIVAYRAASCDFCLLKKHYAGCREQWGTCAGMSLGVHAVREWWARKSWVQ
jgi:hypothetical protein